jgi:hypothetical protein
MSKSLFRGQRWTWLAVAAVTFGLSLTGPAGAQSRRDRNDSPADQIRRQNEVALQKTYSDVADALKEADKVGRKDPEKAVKVLKRMKARVEDDNLLSDAKRDAILKLLKTRIDRWNSEADDQSRTLADRQEKRKLTKQRRYDDEATGKERVDRTKRTIEGIRGAINEGKQIARAKEAGFRGVVNSVEKASIPWDGEGVKWTDDPWLRKQLQKRKITQKLTKKETALLKILNSTISVDFDGAKFKEVISYLEDKTGQTIFVDEESMKEASVDYETPVTLKAKKVGVRSLLRKILNDVGLTYVIKDEIIQVVTLKKARELMVVRTYPIGDLVSNGVAGLPLILQQQQILWNAKNLIDLIQSTIDPTSWSSKNEGGGGGTITFDLPTMALVIKQSTEMHYALASGFRR